MNQKIVICSVSDCGCWLWRGARTTRGYGMMKIAKTRRQVLVSHVVLTAKLRRPLIIGKQALHSCDTPACVNPDHLFEGTQSDNVNDMVSKQRHKPRRGENSATAKLNETSVREIMSLISVGLSHRTIAARFGVGPTLISNIRNGKKWAHIGQNRGSCAS